MSEVRQWLQENRLTELAEVFERERIDLDAARTLTDSDLKELGLPLGLRSKLRAAIQGLQSRAEPQRGIEAAPTLPSQGERRQATVLFSDLSGYTAMNERLDPEEVRGIVGRIKAEAVRIVESHGGIVNQFVGDEVMALFGVPRAHEDDPVRAVRAARDLHAMVRAMAPALETRIGAPLRLHSGISAGLIVTGTEDRRDGTFGVTGDAVNTGARLASLAASDTVLVSEETQRLIADYFQTEALPPADLKGKAGKVTPYRVTGQTGVSSRFEAAAQRGFTAYAGREAELRALHEALEQARGGRGQFVTVMGEPGIGKSRLLFEFRHSVPRHEASVLAGYCRSYGTDTPYLPMIDLLRRGLRLDEAQHANALHDHTVDAVRGISQALERYLPQYLHLLSIPSDAHKIPANLQGDSLRRSFEEAFAAIMTENAKRQPLVLILEDWHWADEASDSVIKHLSGLVPHHPLQVVMTYRPEYERKWANPRHYTPLVLQHLAERDTAAMLCAVWKAEHLPEGLAEQVQARTSGNALFNEEVARALAEDGKISVTAGRAVLKGTLADLHLPDTVQAVIRARVDRLGPEPREVLRLASVIGREFVLPLLEKLHPEPRRIPGALDVLAQQDLIHPLRVVPEPAFLFKHALVQDVVYETLLLSQRKQLHALTGVAIEALYADRLEERYEALADHYSKSEETGKAVEYLEKAGDKALSLSQAGPALDYYRRAVSLLTGAEQTPETQRVRVRVGLKWGRLSWVRPADVLEELNRIIRIAHQLGDKTSEAKLTAFAGIDALYIGDPGAQSYFERAIEQAGPDGDLEARGLACQGLGQLKLFALDLRAALDLSQQAASMLDRLSTVTFHRVNALGIAMQAATWLGYPGTSMEMWRSIEEAMQGNNDDGWWTFWYFFRAVREMYSGNWHEGTRYARLGIERGLSSSSVWGRVHCEFAASACNFWTREKENSQGDLESALQQHLEVSGGQVLSWWYGILAEISVVAGKWRDALERVEQGRKCIAEGDILGSSYLLRAASLIAASNNEHHSAADQFRHGIELCLERGIRTEQSITHFRYAECLHKKGDLAAALEQLAQAEQLFAEMEMNWWSEQAAGVRARIGGGKPFVWFAPYVAGPPKLAG